jgi:hypothetical protein
MDLSAFWPAVRDEYFAPDGDNARPLADARYREVLLRLNGMTTPCVMHLLNRAVQHLATEEIYLEIGVYRGATLIGALVDNHGVALAVDDRSNGSDDGLDNASEFWRNIGMWDMDGRIAGVARSDVHAFFTTYGTKPDRIVELPPTGMPMPTPDAMVAPPVGVLFLDGNHPDADDCFRSLMECRRLLADTALIVADDMNMDKIHDAVYRFVAEEPRATLLWDRRTPGHMHASWWNGVGVIAWQASMSVG